MDDKVKIISTADLYSKTGKKKAKKILTTADIPDYLPAVHERPIEIKSILSSDEKDGEDAKEKE